MRVIILYVSLLVIASGCSSSKRAGKTDMLKDAPEWVQQTPNTPSYYHGIGMIYKSGVQNYRERARQVALSELAGNISVNISSSSYVLLKFLGEKLLMVVGISGTSISGMISPSLSITA
jgi:hypothetical protein